MKKISPVWPNLALFVSVLRKIGPKENGKTGQTVSNWTKRKQTGQEVGQMVSKDSNRNQTEPNQVKLWQKDKMGQKVGKQSPLSLLPYPWLFNYSLFLISLSLIQHDSMTHPYSLTPIFFNPYIQSPNLASFSCVLYTLYHIPYPISLLSYILSVIWYPLSLILYSLSLIPYQLSFFPNPIYHIPFPFYLGGLFPFWKIVLL